MQWSLSVFTLLPCSLFAQATTELNHLEYRPTRQVSRPATARKKLSFEQNIPAPSPYGMGSLRQGEMDDLVRDPQLPLRGVERAVERRARQRGEWVTLDDGSTAWRLAIQSDGASGIRVEFADFAVGSGEVWVYSQDHKQVFGPYTGGGPDDSGKFWSNTVFADNVVVEYLPERPRRDTPFSISHVLHVLPTQQAMAAGTCELDVSCYADWSAVASGVGLYYFQKNGGMYACTGALINNTNKDGKPYFLTANHCVADVTSAKTVNVFWNYQTPTCSGQPPVLSGLPQTLGATFLAGAPIGTGDFSLIQLSPLPSINLVFYGWSGSATALQVGDKTTGVHQPVADFKRISFGVRDPDQVSYVGSTLAPANMYYQVRETAGRIEPGSSGSPLFTQDKVVVGTLTYGPPGDACSISPFSAGYGRFSVALPALTTYLNPPPPPSSGGGGTPPVTPPAPPTPLTVTPSSGNATNSTLSFVFSDSKGYAAISSASVVINSSLSGTGGCYVLYYRGSNVVYLANNANSAWLGPVTLGQSGSIQNSQCTVNAAGSSASSSGNNVTLNLALTFQTSFSGTRNIYMEVYDGLDSGWQQKGSWTVPAVTLGPVSVTPASGTGSSQTFGFVFSDPQGYTAISSVSLVFNSSLSGVGGCYLLYYRGSNVVYLANDTNSAWLGPFPLGQGSATAKNSQCSVNTAGSSALGSGANLTLNLALTFQTAFQGTRNVYMEVYDGADSGWQQKGTWTVSAPMGPVSVTPGSGSGSSQTFGFAFLDPQGYAAISSVSVIINSSLTGAGGCYLLYYRGSNVLYMANDASTGWLPPVVLGQSGSVQNSHCTVNAAGSSALGSGNNLTMNLALSFPPAFQGTRNIYMEAYDGTDSGWPQKGTWTIP